MKGKKIRNASIEVQAQNDNLCYIRTELLLNTGIQELY